MPKKERRFNGGALRKFRAEYKLSQTEVAKALNMAPQSYFKYESDMVVPSADVIMRLADAYNVSTDYLLGRSDFPRPNFYDEKDIKDAFAAREELHQLRNLLLPKVNQRQVVAQ